MIPSILLPPLQFDPVESPRGISAFDDTVSRETLLNWLMAFNATESCITGILVKKFGFHKTNPLHQFELKGHRSR
jgi:hypothetical protein